MIAAMTLKKSLLITAAVLLIALVGTQWYVKVRVADEVSRFEALLVASDDFRVNRFEFEQRLFRSTLHYDVSWRPVTDGPLRTLGVAAGLDQLLSNPTGTIEITHGPWTADAGFGLASVRNQIDAGVLRNNLPQYPGQTPIMTIISKLRFDGGIATTFRSVDYDGRVVGDDGEITQLKLVGLRGRIAINRDFDDIDAEMSLDELRIADQQARLFIESAFARADLARSEDAPLLGSFAGGLATFEMHMIGEGWLIGLGDLRVDSESRMSNGMVNGRSTATLASFQFNDQVYGGFVQEFSMRNLDGAAYAALERLSTQAATQAAPDQEELDGLLLQILQGSPQLSMDRFLISMITDDDLNASFSLSIDGSQITQLQFSEALLQAMSLRAEISASLNALDTLLREIADDDQEVDQMMQMLRAGESPFFVIDGDRLSLLAEMQQGQMTLNGSPMNDNDLLAALLGSIPGLGSGIRDRGEMVFMEGLYENLTLTAGFEPDPYSVSIIAGGDDPAERVLGGDCRGFVNAQQPDIVLDYTAGQFPLSILAQSDADTTLVVSGPDGWSCDDDGYFDMNPGLLFESPQSGRYYIWVGTYEEEQAEAMVHITEGEW
jgi:uncharacterized protein YdgA (DUF945 family)